MPEPLPGKPGPTLLFWFLLVALATAGASLVWWKSQPRERPYDLIEARLYLGEFVSTPPPGTTAIVNLCSREDPYTVEARLWRPVLEGGREPTLDWLREVVDFIDGQREAGRTVYVHCMAGVNRSAAATTAVLMREHDWSREQALAYLRSKRPQVQPSPELLGLLDEWERSSARARQPKPKTP